MTRLGSANFERKISAGLQKLCAMDQNRQCQIIIELSGSETEEVASIVNHSQGAIVRGITLFPGLVAKVPLGIIKDLAQSSQVKKIWADSAIRTTK